MAFDRLFDQAVAAWDSKQRHTSSKAMDSRRPKREHSSSPIPCSARTSSVPGSVQQHTQLIRIHGLDTQIPSADPHSSEPGEQAAMVIG